MIRDKTIEGSFLNIELSPRDFPLRSAADNAAFPRKDATLSAKLLTLRIEFQDKAVSELRAELSLDHAAYTQAEAAGLFGLDAAAREAGMGGKGFELTAPVHLLLRANMERIGPYQFEGLDLMHNDNDLREWLMTVHHDAPKSPYHEFETWTFITAQQKVAPTSPIIGFDRAP